MTREAAVGHLLVLIAIVAGIVGFGLVYDGFAQHSMVYLTTGTPLLFGGLWWAGRELARSNTAAKRRKLLRGSDACSSIPKAM